MKIKRVFIVSVLELRFHKKNSLNEIKLVLCSHTFSLPFSSSCASKIKIIIRKRREHLSFISITSLIYANVKCAIYPDHSNFLSLSFARSLACCFKLFLLGLSHFPPSSSSSYSTLLFYGGVRDAFHFRRRLARKFKPIK